RVQRAFGLQRGWRGLPPLLNLAQHTLQSAVCVRIRRRTHNLNVAPRQAVPFLLSDLDQRFPAVRIPAECTLDASRRGAIYFYSFLLHVQIRLISAILSHAFYTLMVNGAAACFSVACLFV